MKFLTFDKQFVSDLPSDDEDHDLVTLDIIQETQVACAKFEFDLSAVLRDCCVALRTGYLAYPKVRASERIRGVLGIEPTTNGEGRLQHLTPLECR